MTPFLVGEVVLWGGGCSSSRWKCKQEKDKHMITSPKIGERTEQPYVGIKSVVKREAIGATAGKLFGEVFGWLGGRGLAPVGAPFFRYTAVDMEHGIEIEFALPTAEAVAGDDRLLTGVLPAGRYASLLHRGPYDQLYEANGALGNWIKEQGLDVEIVKSPNGDRFGCRIEVYLTDPGVETDPEKWETEVAFKLA
jgi:effector-binding domain-containing protein